MIHALQYIPKIGFSNSRGTRNLEEDEMNPLIMKQKKAQLIIYLLILLILVSCGKKNQIKREPPAPAPTTTTTTTTQPVIPPVVPLPAPPIIPTESIINQEMQARIQQALAKYPCKNNAPRLEFHHHMPVNGNPGSVIPLGGIVQGQAPIGTISKVYMGMYPSFNDFLIVKDVSQGDKIVARSVTLALCQLHPIILPERPLQFQMSSPLNITENPSCVIGNVKGDFLISSTTYQLFTPFTIKNVFINFPICETGYQYY